MSATLSPGCTVFMMSAKEGTVYHSGAIFAPCSTTCQYPPLLTNECFVCTVGSHQICSIFLKSTPFQDHKMCQIRAFYAIFYGQTPTISQAGARMSAVYLLFSAKTSSKNSVKNMILTSWSELTRLLRTATNFSGIETL
jgi:hypothetical protein